MASEMEEGRLRDVGSRSSHQGRRVEIADWTDSFSRVAKPVGVVVESPADIGGAV